MKNKLHILAMVGSLRHNSINQGLLRAAVENLPESMSLEQFDLASIPLFNMDLKVNGDPQAVVDLKKHLAIADALLIITPEYNASIPGILKNAIDWASHPRSQSPLVDKPLAIMGAGGKSGTAFAQRHLHQIADHLKMPVLDTAEVLVSRSWEKFDSQGNLTDPETCRQVANFMQALSDWLRSMRSKRPPISISISRPVLQVAEPVHKN